MTPPKSTPEARASATLMKSSRKVFATTQAARNSTTAIPSDPSVNAITLEESRRRERESERERESVCV